MSSGGDDSPESKDNQKNDDLGRKRKLTASEPIDVPGISQVQDSTTHNSFNVPSWVAGGSPAKYIAIDELMKMQIEMDNMALVHEIALDPNFKIEDIPKNPIETAVRESMHRAYWDLLKQDIDKQPPIYVNAFNLLMEIKQTILEDLLLPHHVRLRSEVQMVLDENTLRNKLEQEEIDVPKIGSFICLVLKRLCCQARINDVEKLAEEENIVELIKGIFGLIDVMKNDMTNYVLSGNRDEIEKYSRELECKQWQEYMKKVPDGDKLTRAWLRAAFDDLAASRVAFSLAEPEAKKEKGSKEGQLYTVTGRAYVKLVEIQKPEPFPETMKIDKLRLEALAEKFLQMVICTSAVWVTCNLTSRQLCETDGFKKTLKDRLVVITNDITESNLPLKLNALAEQCAKEVKDWSEKVGMQVDNSDEQAADIKTQVKKLADPDHAVRKLVQKRVSQFIEQMLQPASSTVSHRLQPGLSVIQNELYAFIARLIRICVHNRKTFANYYSNIICSFEAPPETAGNSSTLDTNV